MRKKYIVACLFLIELVIETVGSLYYDQTPQVVWSIGNAILIMVPLMFGIRSGLLCFLPVLVCEILWFFHLHTAGPLFHLFSFAVAVVLLGLAGGKLKHMLHYQRVIGSSILYELSLLGEESLYRVLMMLFLHRPVTWNNVSGTFLSVANLLLLLLLVYCCLSEGIKGRNMMNSYEIAEEKDIKELFDLQLRAFESEAEMIGSRNVPALMETFEENAADFVNWTVLIRRNEQGEIVGAVRYREEGDHIEIGRVMVKQEYRNRGIAMSLMKAVEERTQADTFELYTCTKSYINIRLYEKLGYRIFKEEKGDRDLSFAYMRKTVD